MPGFSCPQNKCTKCLGGAAIPLACFFMMASLVSIILVIELVLVEHSGSNHFKESECTVVEHVDTGRERCEMCITSGGYHSYTDCYTSYFPCIQVRVRIRGVNMTDETSILHTSHTQRVDYPECSESVCNRQEPSNRKVIDDFLVKWPLNHVAPCAYNPDNPQEVLVAKHYSTTEAVHAVLWPSLVFVICLIVLIARCASGNDPCAQKVKSWDPVTLRSLRESCRVRCLSLCPCCKGKDLEDDDSPTEVRSGMGGHENIAFDKF